MQQAHAARAFEPGDRLGHGRGRRSRPPRRLGERARLDDAHEGHQPQEIGRQRWCGHGVHTVMAARRLQAAGGSGRTSGGPPRFAGGEPQGQPMHTHAITLDTLDAAERSIPPGRPVYMLNLLRYRPQALYRDRPDETPCTGLEAFTSATVPPSAGSPETQRSRVCSRAPCSPGWSGPRAPAGTRRC